jgi:NADH:ubiquinone oxidoreductase subunit 4 (subunit M)
MESYIWIFAAFFLPLFPLSMVFNVVYQRLTLPVFRFILVLVWPLPGIWLLKSHTEALPEWLMYCALATALLYGFRAVVVKEIGMWSGFLATSAWSLCWIIFIASNGADALSFHILSFALPLALMSLLVGEIIHRYESAYVGIVRGLAQAQPRLSGVFIIVMMAAIASPLFPGFFSLLHIITSLVLTYPFLAAGLLLLWLLWSWSGIRLLQELLVGPALPIKYRDISRARAMAYAVLIVLLFLSGMFVSGVLL